MNKRRRAAIWSLLATLGVATAPALAGTVIVRADVKIGCGAAVGIFPHGDNARQFAYMVRYGLSPLGAISAATIDTARCLGQERDLGSIAPGKFTDMIAVTGDPLADVETLRKIAAAIKEGRLITGGNR